MDGMPQQINERRMFAEWMLIFISFPVGGIMALAFIGPMDDVVSAALGGATAGLLIGTVQMIVLRRHIGMRAAWILSTIIGLALGNTVGIVLNGGGTQTTDLLILGAAAGISVGVAQFALLREYLQRAALWPPVVALAWPLGWLVTASTGTSLQLGYVVFESLGGLLFAAITGMVLTYMVRASNAAVRKKAAAQTETGEVL